MDYDDTEKFSGADSPFAGIRHRIAQTEEAALPRKVSNVEVLDLEGKPVTLPYWGEKNLMIFYVDPDHHKQNEDFTVELERTTVPKATRSTASA